MDAQEESALSETLGFCTAFPSMDAQEESALDHGIMHHSNNINMHHKYQYAPSIAIFID
jgi:hypothetical protein